MVCIEYDEVLTIIVIANANLCLNTEHYMQRQPCAVKMNCTVANNFDMGK